MKVPVVGFFTGADVLRNPFKRYNVHVRASYAAETKTFVDMAVGKNKKSIAIFFQNDAFGEAVKSVTEKAMKTHGLAPVAIGNFQRNTMDVEAGLNAIKSSNPDAIVMVGTYKPLAKFVKLAQESGLNNCIFYTVSFVGPEAMAQELGADAKNVYVSMVVPSLSDHENPAVIAYRAALTKYDAQATPTVAGLEAYLNAQVLIRGIKSANTESDREKLIDSIETLTDIGIPVKYGKDDHEGLDTVYLTELKHGQWLPASN